MRHAPPYAAVGASRNKPFCDNSHQDSHFETVDNETESTLAIVMPTGIITITPEPNGPYHSTGRIEILNAGGQVIFIGEESDLCRCGQSANKPLCDGTHNAIGFQAE